MIPPYQYPKSFYAYKETSKWRYESCIYTQLFFLTHFSPKSIPLAFQLSKVNKKVNKKESLRISANQFFSKMISMVVEVITTNDNHEMKVIT